METGTYIPGSMPESPGPLARYLPPLPTGVISAWLQDSFPPEKLAKISEDRKIWLLDPFGASPLPAVEAARAGFAVVVAANNPIARFLIEMRASPPDLEDLRFALAELAATRKGGERLEPHIRSLYKTSCDECNADVEASEFIWDREAGRPVARVYHCPHCNHSGEYPATEGDVQQAIRFREDRLHRARALERVVSRDDPDRRYAEEALEVYPARAVYALFTLINKLDALGLHPEAHRHLTALLLSACDRANALWSYPSGRERPRQLTVSPRFREYNLWIALEKAAQEWACDEAPLPIVSWPERPDPGGGIAIFEGPLRDLAGELDNAPPAAILAALPRPNQAYWTLSALWAGWLWGREAVGPFRSVLRRRRYDWNWHTTALHAAFENLAPVIPSGTPVLGLIGEAEPGFLSAALLAAASAGFALQGLALRSRSGQAQIVWNRSHIFLGLEHTPDAALITTAGDAAVAHLAARREPDDYLHLHCAALEAVIHKHSQRDGDAASSVGDLPTRLNEILERSLTYQAGLLRFGGSEKSLEVGSWWLRKEPQDDETQAEDGEPLSDRVERALVRYLIANPTTLFEALDEHLCRQFRGLLTPESQFIQACAESYAEFAGDGSGLELRIEDRPQARHEDAASMQRLLTDIGERCGYTCSGDRVVVWKDEKDRAAYEFHILASAIIGARVAHPQHPDAKAFIVLPGSRAGLMLYKLKHNPALNRAVEEGWSFLKFRHLRQMAEIHLLERETIDAHLAQDPLTESNLQMRLL